MKENENYPPVLEKITPQANPYNERRPGRGSRQNPFHSETAQRSSDTHAHPRAHGSGWKAAATAPSKAGTGLEDGRPTQWQPH